MLFMNLKLPALFAFLVTAISLQAQNQVDLTMFNKNRGTRVAIKGQLVELTWPAGKSEKARITLNLENGQPLFSKFDLTKKGAFTTIVSQIDPAFILTVGKRTLDPASGGWDVFFDKVPQRPYHSQVVGFNKKTAAVISKGAQTIIRIAELNAGLFSGVLEITLYNGSPLLNIAAVVSTDRDSTAILYDAGLVMQSNGWKSIAWSDVNKKLQNESVVLQDSSTNVEVKYRTIIGESKMGSLAVFPAPHQYFYPLDEAFNLRFCWYGNNYRNMLPGFGLGIRQDPLGDKRYVPWFNAPPKTLLRLNFFCLLSSDYADEALETVKRFTHGDSYKPVPGYKTFQSHFHNEFITKVVLAGKPVPKVPEFVEVFRETGVDIVHLAEFHGPGHPKGPDEERLKELDALFDQCKRLSDKKFLLLPGEEANNFYGGHWLAFFPNPVYWIMSRKPGLPFLSNDSRYGKVYRVNDKDEMLKLLEAENGLAWTAHARTKGSTGFPDAYKNETFYRSATFLGAAWKAIPADLSIPRYR